MRYTGDEASQLNPRKELLRGIAPPLLGINLARNSKENERKRETETERAEGQKQKHKSTTLRLTTPLTNNENRHLMTLHLGGPCLGFFFLSSYFGYLWLIRNSAAKPPEDVINPVFTFGLSRGHRTMPVLDSGRGLFPRQLRWGRTWFVCSPPCTTPGPHHKGKAFRDDGRSFYTYKGANVSSPAGLDGKHPPLHFLHDER